MLQGFIQRLNGFEQLFGFRQALYVLHGIAQIFADLLDRQRFQLAQQVIDSGGDDLQGRRYRRYFRKILCEFDLGFGCIGMKIDVNIKLAGEQTAGFELGPEAFSNKLLWSTPGRKTTLSITLKTFVRMLKEKPLSKP